MPHSDSVGIVAGGGAMQDMLPESLTGGALVAVAVAVLFIVVHVVALVAALTVIVVDAFAARLPSVQFSVCDPTAPVIVHPPVEVVQFTPPPAGNGSLKVTAIAVAGPRLVTTIVNTAVAPGVIEPPSGVFAI